MTTDSSMLSPESPLPATENYLLLAAQLAAANLARPNPKLASQALSAAPLALKLLRPKNVVALVEEEQRVILGNGSLVVHMQQGEISVVFMCCSVHRNCSYR